MAVAATSTVVLRGVSGQLVRVEADLSTGLPTLAFTGLAGASITEARDRIRSAVTNAGIGWPNRRITVALLPADLPKSGSHLDLALALAVLAAAEEVSAPVVLESTVWLAELGLDGALRPVRGVLPAVLAAREAGIGRVVVAHANGPEAALVQGVEVRTAAHLAQVLASLEGGPGTDLPLATRAAEAPPPLRRADLADVAGQPLARRAVEVAAAGGHHLFLQGVPGSGKTMLAERLPGLLPPLSDRAALELTALHSVAGRLRAESGLLRHAPFEAPHHSATLASMIGGGSGIASPGAISLAHHGVLFLDEAPQRCYAYTCGVPRTRERSSEPSSATATPSPRPARPERGRTYPPYKSYDVDVVPGTQPIDLYLRLSKYHRDGQDAIERQRLDLTRKLEASGSWTIVGEYVDNDSASASAVRTRRGWRQLNESIEQGRTTAVAFWKLDRTNRVAHACLEWLAKCRSLSVHLVSHQDSADELNSAAAAAKLSLGLKALLAEVETDTMSERQLAAKAHAAEAGYYHGGQVPFGWVAGTQREVDEHGRTGVRLLPHPVEHPALKAAVDMVLQGASLSTIARTWKDEYGITTADGRPIYVATVLRALRSPRCMGYRLHRVPERRRGELPADLMRYVVRSPSGEPIVAQEPVCDRVTWLRVQRALDAARTTPTRRPWGSREWLLTGVARCVCGRRLYGAQRRRGEVVEFNYTCLANTRIAPGSCVGVSIGADKLELFARSFVEGYLSDERVAAARRRLDSHTEQRANVVEVQQLAEAQQERETLLEHHRNGEHRSATVGLLLTMLDEVDVRIERLQRRLDDQVIPVDEPDAYRGMVDQWPTLTLDQRRYLLSRVIGSLVVSPGRGPVERRVSIEPAF